MDFWEYLKSVVTLTTIAALLTIFYNHVAFINSKKNKEKDAHAKIISTITELSNKDIRNTEKRAIIKDSFYLATGCDLRVRSINIFLQSEQRVEKISWCIEHNKMLNKLEKKNYLKNASKNSFSDYIYILAVYLLLVAVNAYYNYKLDKHSILEEISNGNDIALNTYMALTPSIFTFMICIITAALVLKTHHKDKLYLWNREYLVTRILNKTTYEILEKLTENDKTTEHMDYRLRIKPNKIITKEKRLLGFIPILMKYDYRDIKEGRTGWMYLESIGQRRILVMHLKRNRFTL
ncbi:hypothetical protein E0X81_05915 [Halomonas sp. GDM18]|nr:hypothetical protein E0X81_05915 [Halomonas sp. GDM18]